MNQSTTKQRTAVLIPCYNEELTIAAYIGQGANLTRGAVGPVGTLLSVEARQVAWLLDLAGKLPAPHAADPPGKPEEILGELRKRRFIS